MHLHALACPTTHLHGQKPRRNLALEALQILLERREARLIHENGDMKHVMIMPDGDFLFFDFEQIVWVKAAADYPVEFRTTWLPFLLISLLKRAAYLKTKL